MLVEDCMSLEDRIGEGVGLLLFVGVMFSKVFGELELLCDFF